MTVQTIYDLIQTVAPFDTQMEYDNSGLLVGSPSQEIKNILFALDVTQPVIDEAVAIFIRFRGNTGPRYQLVFKETDLNIALIDQSLRLLRRGHVDRHRPVLIRHDLVSRITGSNFAAVRELVLLVSCSVEIINRQILKSDVLAVVHRIDDLPGRNSIACVDRCFTQIRDLIEDLAIRYLLRGTDGAAAKIIHIGKTLR